jgi:hypothetical protein
MCLAAACSFLLQLAPSGFAASGGGQGEYDAGVKAYKAKDYKGASDHFAAALKQGKQSPTLWLYCGHCFAGMGQTQRAYQAYEVVVKSFGGTSEATTAAQLMEKIKPSAPAATGSAGGATPAPLATPGATGLAARIIVIAPLFHHEPVSQQSIAAVKDAIAALPPHLRKLLDDNGTAAVIAPNIIDRWPESLKDLPEEDPAETMAELPGRIYGKEMCVYERAKVRHSTNLKAARPPRFIKQQILNMCFQQLDDLKSISKDPALRAEWEADKERVPENVAPKLATFMKADDWGPRETCSELTGAMLGAGDDNTDLLYRYFTRTKNILATKLGIKP